LPSHLHSLIRSFLSSLCVFRFFLAFSYLPSYLFSIFFLALSPTFFFFSFGVPQLMLPEAPQFYGLL
jgi:hypothetical protein